MVEQATSHSKRLGIRPMAESLLLGALAVLVVQLFRAGFHRSIPLLVVETLVYLVIPVLVFGWVLRRNQVEVAQTQTSLKYGLQLGAIVFALLPILIQVITRLFGIGDATEVVFLMMIHNAAWYLTVFAAFWNFRRAGFLLSSSLVLFVCLTTNLWYLYGLA